MNTYWIDGVRYLLEIIRFLYDLVCVRNSIQSEFGFHFSFKNNKNLLKHNSRLDLEAIGTPQVKLIGRRLA
jgi:hypothetical protein